MVDYLKKRGIDQEVIDYCIQTGRLYESRNKGHSNVVFVGFDKDGKARFGCLRGIGEGRFHGDLSGSDKHYSFALPACVENPAIHLCESAIDVMSYATLCKLDGIDFLGQGTIYPDVVESGLGGESVVIKSHHNVGGLPDCVDFKDIVEPLRRLFKDEVRQLGIELGLPEQLVWRQPFPGPGLAIRVIGEITEEKLEILRDADAIFREEMALAGLDRTTSQYFAVLTSVRSVGVMGDERTYDYAVALRAVTTTDFMTAESYNMPWDVLGTVTSRIVNEVKHVNRVFYDCTGKPPATIELE